MKFIWNMTDREIWKEGLTAGSLMAGVGVVAGIYEGDMAAVAIGGLTLASLSGMGLLGKKLREIEEMINDG